MEQSDSGQRLASAAEQFNRHGNREDGAQVAGCLADGLTVLRDSLSRRLHQDVERFVGMDSMLVPVSKIRALRLAAHEIEAYQIAESTAAAAESSYVGQPEEWFLPWLVQLRLGEGSLCVEITQRARSYLSEGPDRRRLAFADKLATVLPESRRAPLVLFRLVPLSVGIATALAFGDAAAASRLRADQTAVLPAIADCRQCRGRVLPCAQQCDACGNPLWKYECLTAAD